VRKVMYTLHGKKGAIRVEDEDVELAVLEAGPGVVAPGSPGKWRFERRVAPSNWMDASTWAGSARCLTNSAAPSRARIRGQDAMEACLCIELIERGYRSAAEGSRVLDLPDGADARTARPRAPRPLPTPGHAEDLA